jgi:hypothetical protein
MRRPYILTANHVVSGKYGATMRQGQMNDIQTLTAFTFGLEAALCGGPTAGGAVAVMGATIVAHDPKRDLLLLQLSTSLPPELVRSSLAGARGQSIRPYPSAIHVARQSELRYPSLATLISY